MKENENILVVDDDKGMNFALCEVLKKRGYKVTSVFSAEEGLEQLARKNFDLILLDLMLPGMSGVEAIPCIRELDAESAVILMTAHGSKSVALEAVAKGAYDYFTKPFDLTEMEIIVKRALERRRLQAEVKVLRESLRQEGTHSGLVGQSQAIKRVMTLIERIAALETTVLITGESGTGKELVADLIHHGSRRAGKPFIKVNCAAIPEGLLESELFGHERGAFTGATSARPGKFELAQSGTILLDEVGDTPLSIQAKLLRVLEQRQLERLGATRTIDLDIRIVAATNQDLLKLAGDKQFREDLYYRLNVASIHLPPLRGRKEDIPLLAQNFLQRTNVKIGTDLAGITRDGMQILLDHDWPGNVRELANTLERAAIFSSGQFMTARDVQAAMQRMPFEPNQQDSAGVIPLSETLSEVEKHLIVDALTRCGNVQTEAAKMLGVSAKNLWKKIRKHGLKLNEDRPVSTRAEGETGPG